MVYLVFEESRSNAVALRGAQLSKSVIVSIKEEILSPATGVSDEA